MITSVSNQRIKRVRALQAGHRARREAAQFVIEGVHLVREALVARWPIQEAYVTQTFAHAPAGESLLRAMEAAGAPLEWVSQPVLASLSDTRTPQGIVAVLPMRSLSAPPDPTFVLVIDAVTDPGNLGTILRLAAGAAVPVVYVAPGTVDVFSPKVVRGAAGAHFHVWVLTADWADIRTALADRPVLLADSSGGDPHFAVDWTQSCGLIVSGESSGPSPEARAAAQRVVTIPMPGGTESLNVATAAGILLYEMLRQRFYVPG